MLYKFTSLSLSSPERMRKVIFYSPVFGFDPALFSEGKIDKVLSSSSSSNSEAISIFSQNKI